MVSWTEDFLGSSAKLVFVSNASIIQGGICGGLRSMVGWILKVVVGEFW